MFPFILSALAEDTDALTKAENAAEEAAKETAEPFISLVKQPFEELAEAGWLQVLILIALAVGGILLLSASKKKVKWSAKMLAHAAMALALSFVLSYIKLFSMGAGGSITPGSMLPVMLFSANYGLLPGLFVGFVYAVLQLVQKNSAVGIFGYLLDYFLAFSALGLAGIAKNLPKQWGLYVGMLLAMFVRFVCHALSSIVVYHVNLAGSLAYNIPYMVPEIIFCMILGVLIGPRVLKLMRET